MKEPVFNIEQRVMTLNWLSNSASNKFGTASQLQEEMQRDLEKLLTNASMQSKIGKWELEWGPVVIQEGKDLNTKVATNAMFVAKQTAYNGHDDHYVIAVAGTNAISMYGWFVEDFKTEELVLWSQAANEDKTCKPTLLEPSAPRVSQGTCIGLTLLLNMAWQAPKPVGKNKPIPVSQTLVQFLDERFGENPIQHDLVSVTGHSLGGALSSALALRLAEAQLRPSGSIKKAWNPLNTVTLTAMPTAGPTPGNKAFSDYYNNTIGFKTTRVWNKMDPVPYGHQPDMIRAIPSMYYPYIVPDAGLYAVVGILLTKSIYGTSKYPEGGEYTQLMAQTAPLPGQFNSVFAAVPPGVIIRFSADFLLKKLLPMMGIKDEKRINQIIIIVNDTIKIMGWLTKTRHEVLEAINKALSSIPGVELVMKTLAWLIDHLKGVFAFLQQLGYQHVWAYADLLGLTGVQQLVQEVTKTKDPHTDFERMLKAVDEWLANILHQTFTNDYLKQNGLSTISEK
ncbi:MAG: hypothetical protein HYZ43_10900 [Flavobacteriia bacterium]|nr:hypothetical protein [Flavobacteriia bacterium]